MKPHAHAVPFRASVPAAASGPAIGTGPATRPGPASGAPSGSRADTRSGTRSNSGSSSGQGAVHRIGSAVSAWVADVSANPLSQLAFVAGCAAWLVLGLPVEVLTGFLSILAITLTQMVLNKQNVREADAHRRDVALHAKLDELVHASHRARDEIAGIEELEEEEIERLKRARGAVAGNGAGDEPPAPA